MRNNEYNPNLKTEYSALQNEYSPAKPEFAFDPIQEYGAGADELKAAEEYEASGETTLEEDTKKRRSFKKRMLKMFTAAAASVVLVVGSGLVASQNNHSNNLKQTDEYNEILDQLLLLAEEERYDEFHEILSSSELEECIQFFETDFYYFEDGVEKTLDGSFWTYDGEYARNSHGVSENHEKEDKLLQVDVFFTEEGYFYSVQHTPTCQSKKKHMDQQGTYEEKYYSYNGEMDEYFAHSGIISGSTTGESLYDIFSRDNSFFERNDEADAALSRRETFWEYWDDGPRGRCTYKEIWKRVPEYDSSAMLFSEDIEAEFDNEGNLITEKCVIKKLEYNYNEDGSPEKTESTFTLAELESDPENYEYWMNRITEIFTETPMCFK